MIMQGTPPRRLSWLGLLTVLAVGAALLPILPTRADEPKPEKSPDGKKIRVRVATGEDASKLGEIQKLKAQVEAQRARLKEAEAALQQAVEQLKSKTPKTVAPKAATTTGRYRIIIVGPDGEKKELKWDGKEGMTLPKGIGISEDLLRQLGKEQADKLRAALEKAKGASEKVRESNELGLGENPLKKLRSGERRVLVLPRLPEAPQAPRLARVVGVTSKQDARIEELEKKLNNVLEELQQLRKEMKKDR